MIKLIFKTITFHNIIFKEQVDKLIRENSKYIVYVGEIFKL